MSKINLNNFPKLGARLVTLYSKFPIKHKILLCKSSLSNSKIKIIGRTVWIKKKQQKNVLNPNSSRVLENFPIKF